MTGTRARTGTTGHPCDAACPRCDYDLRGDVATWAEACPLEGWCPECGLSFSWHSVMVGGERPPRWSIERPGVRLRRTLPGTFVRTLRPGRFWSAMPLAFRGGLVRASAGSLAVCALIVALAGVLETALDLTIGRLTWIRPLSASHSHTHYLVLATLDAMTSPFGMYSWSGAYGYTRVLNTDVMLVLQFVVMWPIAMLALPVTLRRCRVRRAHLIRAFIYGLPWAVLWGEALFLFSLVNQYSWRIPFVSNRPMISNVFNALKRGNDTGVLWFVVLVLVQWVWWNAVNRRYLRLPTPRAVTLAALAVAGLATLIPLFAFTRTGMQLVNWLGL